MRRREFITLIGGAAVWPLALRAQQQTMPAIGFLGSTSAASDAYLIAAFRQGLSEAGYVEGRNVAIEYRWAEGQYDRLPAMISELLQRHVAVIAALGTPSALAAKTATTMIPIVFGVSEDPVKLGLVASVARPGGNSTGASYPLSELGAKQLGLLRELVPAAGSVGLLVNPSNENAEAITGDLNAAAATIGVEIDVVRATDSHEIEEGQSARASGRH
jgi:putative ABC transport system substrate-binding protein